MPETRDDFSARIDRLQAELVQQGARVLAMVELAFDSVFTSDSTKAGEAIRRDDEIDHADVAIEQETVRLLSEATSATASLDQVQLRRVLMIVKINNEMERVADVAVDVGELVLPMAAAPAVPSALAFPPTFRIMANSVIGILRDTNAAFARGSLDVARVVLKSQHAVTEFKAKIVRVAEHDIAAGRMSVDFAFRLHEIASLCELIADHCTNIAEQVIYAHTGAIVRHGATSWVELGTKPGAKSGT
ncbi:MAG: PhoU domain-containing protein [Planctomycetota bacterium]|nr:PhoU domain-containing protein [Planctomycetota bacterium]